MKVGFIEDAFDQSAKKVMLIKLKPRQFLVRPFVTDTSVNGKPYIIFGSLRVVDKLYDIHEEELPA